ncbi:Fe-S cluster assembly protein SufD [Nicoliella spurrieriana]|uniref:Fe-S cluster assembly protein SufD n=1 Tax=Nicoliella spurrieriana TaxID=2925830 RepID=A0A976RTA6_9LACO|nr:Fe-S cluster assembly protein SufD [Nicoliella spurrieriana]UQS87319.1 Fe-S cluster assembly protein SufD [Nicoliella spurrieriana]
MIKDKFMRQVSPTMIAEARFDNEPEWMTQYRTATFESMGQLSLPVIAKMDYHTWRFVSNASQHQAVTTPLDDDTKHELQHYNCATIGKRVFRNEPNAEMITGGVICCDFATALHKYPEMIKSYLVDNQSGATDRLNCLQNSLVNNGIFIYVPAGVQLSEPIKIAMMEDNYQPDTTFSRVIVVAANDSKVDIVQKLGSIGDAKKVTHVNIDVYAKPNSEVQFFSLDAIGASNTAYVMRRAQVGRRAKMNWMIGSFNDGNTISDIATNLNGEGSKGNTRVVSIASHRQQQGINTNITNYGRHSDGEISQRGAILDQARIVFNGIGKVAHGAHGANNQQENSVLMLSDDASGDANPILLIDENDVIAGHKASIGKIDERQLYYLMSRGIKPEVAKKLVIRGFLGIILSHIPSATIKQQMIDIIEGKLAND